MTKEGNYAARHECGCRAELTRLRATCGFEKPGYVLARRNLKRSNYIQLGEVKRGDTSMSETQRV
jgi:hypothetical protein